MMAVSGDSTFAPNAHTPTRRELFKAAPIAAVALAIPVAAGAVSTGDAKIIAAWDRRVAAYRTYNGAPVSNVDDDGSDENFWPVIDRCDTIIQNTTAATPLGVEIQIWVGLHNSAAWTCAEENAFLARDLAFMDDHQHSFDWGARPMIAAIRSLRAMGSR